jgi:uncharacterized protein (TIGR02646 family)
MKHIQKQQSPQYFEDWKTKNPRANWNNFSGTNEHSNLRTDLIAEQNQMCCYCEVKIENNGTSSHIEHLKDRKNFPKEMFNYDNLLASCQFTDSCGHKKGTGYFYGFVSPLDPNCQNRFTYTRDGRIIPVNENDTNAEKTIKVLGLNCRRLKDRRRTIIKTLENENQEYKQKSLTNFLDWYGGFYTVIEYMN